MRMSEAQALIADDATGDAVAVARSRSFARYFHCVAFPAVALIVAGLFHIVFRGDLPARAKSESVDYTPDFVQSNFGDGDGRSSAEQALWANNSAGLKLRSHATTRALKSSACEAGTHWRNYCSEVTTSKVFASTPNCARVWWMSDALDLEEEALTRCGSHCSVYDRGGEKCFKCGLEPPSARHAQWSDYCRSGTPKHWVTDQRCDAYGWASGGSSLHRAKETCSRHASPGSGCYVFDHNGEGCRSEGPADLRDRLQACLQYREQWCWATSVIILSNFYVPDKTQVANNDCRGLECQVVAFKTGLPCCDDRDTCRSVDGRPHDITSGLKRRTGMLFRVWYKSLGEWELKRVLARGHPLIIGVGWSSGSGHLMVVGGTDGDGRYFLHDPQYTKGEGSFQSLTYAQLLDYHAPYGSLVGRWRETYGVAKLGDCGVSGKFSEEWGRYCKARSPKAWAFRDDCSLFHWRWGGQDPVKGAMKDCGDGCFAYDRNGRRCHEGLQASTS